MHMGWLADNIVDCIGHILTYQQWPEFFVKVTHQIAAITGSILKAADYNAGFHQ